MDGHTDGRTDRHDNANSRFRNFAKATNERDKNLLLTRKQEVIPRKWSSGFSFEAQYTFHKKKKTIQAVIGFSYLCPGRDRFETSAGTTSKFLAGVCRGFPQHLEANSGILPYDILILLPSAHFPVTALLTSVLFNATYVKLLTAPLNKLQTNINTLGFRSVKNCSA
jgi:hypothetical protein